MPANESNAAATASQAQTAEVVRRLDAAVAAGVTLPPWLLALIQAILAQFGL